MFTSALLAAYIKGDGYGLGIAFHEREWVGVFHARVDTFFVNGESSVHMNIFYHTVIPLWACSNGS